MTTHALGQGERLQRSRERQVKAIKGSLFAVGLIGGGSIGYLIASGRFALGAPWPPAIAIGLAMLYAAAVAIGSLLLQNRIDEVERMQTYKAVTVAGTAYLVGYPLWFLLWKASLAPEPVHWLLFILFWLLLAGSALYYRPR